MFTLCLYTGKLYSLLFILPLIIPRVLWVFNSCWSSICAQFFDGILVCRSVDLQFPVYSRDKHGYLTVACFHSAVPFLNWFNLFCAPALNFSSLLPLLFLFLLINRIASSTFPNLGVPLNYEWIWGSVLEVCITFLSAWDCRWGCLFFFFWVRQ